MQFEDRPACPVRSPADGDGPRTHAGPVPGSESSSLYGNAAIAAEYAARLAAAPGVGHGPSRDLGTAAAPVTVPGSEVGTIKETVGGTGTSRMETGDESDVAALLPAARAAWDRLSSRGDALTRDTLAAELRRSGHPVGNAKVPQRPGQHPLAGVEDLVEDRTADDHQFRERAAAFMVAHLLRIDQPDDLALFCPHPQDMHLPLQVRADRPLHDSDAPPLQARHRAELGSDLSAHRPEHGCHRCRAPGAGPATGRVAAGGRV